MKKPLIFYKKPLTGSSKSEQGALKIHFFGGPVMKLTASDLPRQILFSAISSLFDRRKDFLSNPGSDFTRVKKISFEQTILFPMVAGSEDTATELIDFFPEGKVPFPSAMIQRRNQVKLEAFKTLFQEFTTQIPIRNTFQGFQLACFDGTRSNLPYHPADKETYIQCIEDRKGINQMHINCLYDPLNDVFLDAELQGIHQMDEKDAFCIVLERQKYNDKKRRRIYLADRGFASFNVCAHAIHNGQLFLLRTPVSFAQALCADHKEWMDKPFFDEELSVHIGRCKTKKNLALENYHYINRRRRYDFIEPGSQETDLLQLRILKFPIAEDSYEYIVTNLPKYGFSESTIKELYNLRWNEELAFRHLKYAGNLVHIHSLKKEHLIQEIYGKLAMYNFSAFMAAVIGKIRKKTDMYTYVLNHTQGQKICIRFLKGKIKDPVELICRYLVPVRPGRSFERNLRRQSADTLNYR